eukprot:7455325-Pyramimonas_sp.AAC.1
MVKQSVVKHSSVKDSLVKHCLVTHSGGHASTKHAARKYASLTFAAIKHTFVLGPSRAVLVASVALLAPSCGVLEDFWEPLGFLGSVLLVDFEGFLGC